MEIDDMSALISEPISNAPQVPDDVDMPQADPEPVVGAAMVPEQDASPVMPQDEDAPNYLFQPSPPPPRVVPRCRQIIPLYDNVAPPQQPPANVIQMIIRAAPLFFDMPRA